jgi:hypothetical protein
MSWVWILAGIVIVIVGLLDVFFTVLNYDGFGFLSSRLYRTTWTLTRLVTSPLPERIRAGGRSLGAPMMIPATLALWMALQILGFALIYYANITKFSFTGGAEPGFMNAIYLSGVTVTTLGFGDITPAETIYGLVAFTQAAIGFSIITLVISYVLNIYQVLLQWNTLSANLYHQAKDSTDPRSFLKGHFPDGEPWGLSGTLGNLHENLVAYYEGMRRYPIVYYFYSRSIQRAIPYVFHMGGESAAALRWGLPKGHPATKDPQLSVLLTGISDLTLQIENYFLPKREREEPPKPVDYDSFAEALRTGEAKDPWLSTFINLRRSMQDLVHTGESGPEDAYEQYREWLPFIYRVDNFVRATAGDLGYDPGQLEKDWRS